MKSLSKNPAGVTLLELMIAVFMLAFISMVFISAIRATNREIKFSGEHFTGFFLSQKVNQDLSEEIRVNPHAFSTLGIEQSAAVSTEITEGASVFFSNIEFAGNQAARRNIDKAMMPLYEQVKPFRLLVSAEKNPSLGIGEPENLFLSNIAFNWDAKTGKGYYKTGCLFFAPLKMKSFQDSMSLDQDTVASEFRDFYRRSPDSPTMAQLARIHYSTKTFLDSNELKSILETIKTKENELGSVSPQDKDRFYKTCFALAQSWYSLAQMSFHAFAIIGRDLSGYSQTNPLPSTHPYLRRTQKNCVMTFRTFCRSIDKARFHYARLLDADLAMHRGAKQMDGILIRLLDINKVMTCIPHYYFGGFDPQFTLGQYRKYLDVLKNFSEYRNPFLNRYARQENSFLNDGNEMFERYPQLAFVKEVLHDGLGEFLKPMAPSVLSNFKN